jgi:hypothetical protein
MHVTLLPFAYVTILCELQSFVKNRESNGSTEIFIAVAWCV